MWYFGYANFLKWKSRSGNVQDPLIMCSTSYGPQTLYYRGARLYICTSENIDSLLSISHTHTHLPFLFVASPSPFHSLLIATGIDFASKLCSFLALRLRQVSTFGVYKTTEKFKSFHQMFFHLWHKDM